MVSVAPCCAGPMLVVLPFGCESNSKAKADCDPAAALLTLMSHAHFSVPVGLVRRVIVAHHGKPHRWHRRCLVPRRQPGPSQAGLSRDLMGLQLQQPTAC